MMKQYRDFNAKILLFGEYSVICNSMGLTIPYTAWSGRLRVAGHLTDEQRKSAESLKRFYHYLVKKTGDNQLQVNLRLNEFKDALENGLYFDSEIPPHYGVGSSGALCAAVFDAFAEEEQSGSLLELKSVFAQMEAWFHGVSSGLDPLISYINKPLLVKEKKEPEVTEFPKGLFSTEISAFLVDTEQQGKTDRLVRLFSDKCRHYDFYKRVKHQLIPINNKCIRSFTVGETAGFYDHVKQLSAFFLEHFKPMIPKGFSNLWKRGLDDDTFALKLCGSGGGGFLLGFTHDFDAAKKKLENNTIIKLSVNKPTM